MDLGLHSPMMKATEIQHFEPGQKWLPFLWLLTITLLLVSGLASQNPSGNHRIAIVSIDQSPSTDRTIKGIKKAFKRYGLEPVYEEAVLSGNPSEDKASFERLRNFTPLLFITIGSYATGQTATQFPNHPIIFANVLAPKSSGFVNSMGQPGGNITGAALDIPPDIQFKYFKRVVGQIKKVGVLYTSETESAIVQAKTAASQLNLELVCYKINSEREIPGAIDSLCQVTDALWSVADPNIYTPQSTRHIILQTLRYGVPLMGFSLTLVEAGGLFTLDFDFKDIGRQAGETAIKVLNGYKISEIAVTTPGIIYFKYNENTARQINLDIPEDLLAVAKEVIK